MAESEELKSLLMKVKEKSEKSGLKLSIQKTKLKLKTCAPLKKNCDKSRQCMKKQRHHFANKGRIVKAMVFPIVMYRCESCSVKKAEHRRMDAFELWCWRRPLRVLWTARRSKQSILKEINSE